MTLTIQPFKHSFFTFVFVASLSFFISCSTIDYFSYSNYSHGTKNINQNQISLITYNIKAIYKKEQGEVDNLMNYINSEGFNFVMFQELFNESNRDHIIEHTDTNHFKTIISRVDYNSFPELIFQDAGLFMMSSYPRVNLTDIEFGDGIKNSNGVIHMILEKEMSKTNDFLANKSVLGALFEIDQVTKLFLFTTHVQAIGTTEIKETQLRQIKYFIDEAVTGVLKAGTVKSSENLIVLLAGDFNSNAYEKERFASMMNILGYPRDLHKELHGEKEEYTFRFGSNNASRRFDYIIAYDSIGSAVLRNVEVESIGTIDIKDDAGNSISDHLGLKATLRIK